MIIKELIESSLFDENEQVVILYGDVQNPYRLYTGYLSEIPTDIQDKKIEQISAMGEERRKKWSLNSYGWLEIWMKEE